MIIINETIRNWISFIRKSSNFEKTSYYKMSNCFDLFFLMFYDRRNFSWKYLNIISKEIVFSIDYHFCLLNIDRIQKKKTSIDTTILSCLFNNEEKSSFIKDSERKKKWFQISTMFPLEIDVLNIDIKTCINIKLINNKPLSEIGCFKMKSILISIDNDTSWYFNRLIHFTDIILLTEYSIKCPSILSNYKNIFIENSFQRI